MNPLPLISREFQVALRRPLTLRLRLAFGGGSMLVTVWSILVSATNSGLRIFEVLIAAGAVLCMAVSIFAASDSVSRERREGTLGFLFLTDLRASDVILGKIAAAGLVPFYTLMGMFPAFAVCLLVGGVPGGVFWRSMLALLATLAFALCVTLYISSFCEDHRKAFGGSAIMLLVANPLWLEFAALRFGTGSFIALMACALALAVILFRFASIRLQRHWRDPERVITGGERKVQRRKSILLERAPVAWLMLRRAGVKRWKGLAAVAFTVLVLIAIAKVPTLRLLRDGLFLLFAIHLACEFIILTRTSYAFFADRRTGALELFLGSQLSNEEIFAGFNSFLTRRSAFALVLVGMVDVGYSAALWRLGGGALAVLPLAMGLAQGITLAGVGWLGVYRALMLNHPSLAILGTFAQLSLGPIVLTCVFLLVPHTNILKVASFYILATSIVAMFCSLNAKTALAVHGRALLLRPAAEKPPHIESEWSFIDWEEAHEENSYEKEAPAAG